MSSPVIVASALGVAASPGERSKSPSGVRARAHDAGDATPSVVVVGGAHGMRPRALSDGASTPARLQHDAASPLPTRYCQPGELAASPTHSLRAAPAPSPSSPPLHPRPASSVPAFRQSPPTPLKQIPFISPAELEVERCVGIGGFGRVYRASWHGTPVAYKLITHSDDISFSAFDKEAQVMITLRHPNIVMMLGAVYEPPVIGIVAELLSCSLYDRLHHQPSRAIDPHALVLDAARGLAYLHKRSPPVYHLDIKSLNCLLDERNALKLTDFGLSRIKRHTTAAMTSVVAGTVEYAAPEVIRHDAVNDRADVYSFGVLMWEIFSRRRPWEHLTPMQVMMRVALGTRQLPQLPPRSGCSASWALMLESCLRDEPTLRPDMEQVLQALQSSVSAEMVLQGGANASPRTAAAQTGASGGARQHHGNRHELEEVALRTPSPVRRFM